MNTNKKEIELKVTGMTCSHCEMTVKKALESINGVKKAKVNRNKNNALVTFKSNIEIDINELIKAVSDSGYEASL
jgi:copper chaperone CopZ